MALEEVRQGVRVQAGGIPGSSGLGDALEGDGESYVQEVVRELELEWCFVTRATAGADAEICV